MDDRDALRLGQCDDERLLPVRHEPGVNVGLDDHGVEIGTGVEESDAVLVDLEAAADLAVNVEEGEHLRLQRAADEDVSLGRKCRRCPARSLIAVEESAVRVAGELCDALDADDAVGVDRDDRAHLLKDVDEIHDLRLDRRAAELRDALSANGRQKHLLRRADTRIRQLDLRAAKTGGSRDADSAGELLDDGPERTENIEVVVDRTVADAASAQVGNEGLTQSVEQRPAEENRDAARPRVRVDVRHVSRLDG